MPDQFWSLTLRELILQMRGFTWRQEQEDWRMANIVAAIMNPLRTVQVDPKKLKRNKTVTAADVLGKGKQKPKNRATTPEAQKAIFDGLVQRTKHWQRRDRKREPSPT